MSDVTKTAKKIKVVSRFEFEAWWNIQGFPNEWRRDFSSEKKAAIAAWNAAEAWVSDVFSRHGE